jgi:nicotinamidase-related amidase
MDSKELGFETYVIIDGTKGIDSPEGNIDKSLNVMRKKRIEIIESNDL